MAGEREKGRKRKPTNKLGVDNPAQSQRFMQAAKESGADESGEAFTRAMDKLVPKKGKKAANS
jgi:hypothetical protein